MGERPRMRAGDDAQLMSHPAIFLILHQMPEATSFSSFDFMHPLQKRKSPPHPLFFVLQTHTHTRIYTTDFSGSSLIFHSFLILSLFFFIGCSPALLKEMWIHIFPVPQRSSFARRLMRNCDSCGRANQQPLASITARAQPTTAQHSLEAESCEKTS